MLSSLHPTHTAYKKAMGSLAINIDSFVLNIYGWFKLSSARREDMIELFDALNEKIEFFLRLVSTRWLSMGPVLVRLDEHWESLQTYFLKKLTDPEASQSSKLAVKTDRYKDIVTLLKPSAIKSTQARVKFAIFIFKQSEPFLTSLQCEKPAVHRIYKKSVELVVGLMSLVV